ncbi:unnamed protein product [Pleuronectes platessa]|uniref:Uncharacterized protein n=1 Tax=Pleuronectes platessa TaxID=8262 RepID=A0A9N7V7V4_PLEPL|nr:unnamed protein product [Pleuronectes platessa]
MSSSFCQEDPSEATGVSLTSITWTEHFVLLDEEQEGQPGEKEKPGSTDAFTETGREGLLCMLRVQAQQAAAGLKYSGTAAQSLDDSSEDENMASSSQEKQYRCASAPRSLLQPPLLMLTSCLHHTKQQTWIDRPFSRAAPSL